MFPKYGIFLILLVFLPLSATIPSSGSNQSSKSIDGYRIPITESSGIGYSTFVDNNKGVVNVYMAYESNSNLVLSNATLYSSESVVNSNNSKIPLSSFSIQSKDLVGWNYFISNNSKFLVLATNLSIKVVDLSNNRSWESTPNGGTGSSYFITSINRFSTNPDVYFSFYSGESFYLVKYDFQLSRFSIIINQTVSASTGSQIENVRTFMLDDKLYISVASCSTQTFNLNNFTTNIYIVSSKGIIFNKELSKIAVTSFTSLSYGLLLYSFYDSSYFNYFYYNNSIIPFKPVISSYDNSSLFCPYDNSSFLLLNSNNFALYNQINSTYFQKTFYYNIKNNDYPNFQQKFLQAITLDGSEYYLLYGLNLNNQYEMYFSNILNAPTDFSIINTYNANNSTNIFPLANPFIILFFSIIIVLLPLVLILYATYRRNKPSQYYPGQNYSNYYRNQYYSGQKPPDQQNQQNAQKPHLSCSKCGATADPGDIFCNNCGSRL